MDTRLSPSIKIPTNSPSSWQWEAKHTAVSKGWPTIESRWSAWSLWWLRIVRHRAHRARTSSNAKIVSQKFVRVKNTFHVDRPKFQIENIAPCFFFFFLIWKWHFYQSRAKTFAVDCIYTYNIRGKRKKKKEREERNRKNRGGKRKKREGTETAWRQNEPILGLLRSFSTLSPRH